MASDLQGDLFKIQAAYVRKDEEIAELGLRLGEAERLSQRVSLQLDTALSEAESLRKMSLCQHEDARSEASATAQLAACLCKLTNLQDVCCTLEEVRSQCKDLAASKQEAEERLACLLTSANAQKDLFSKQLEDLVNVHEAKIQDLMSALEAKDRQHVAQAEELARSHREQMFELQAHYEAKLRAMEMASNAAAEAKYQAEHALLRERAVWQAALASMNESQAREESLKARLVALRQEINALKSRRGGLGS